MRHRARRIAQFERGEASNREEGRTRFGCRSMALGQRQRASGITSLAQADRLGQSRGSAAVGVA